MHFVFSVISEYCFLDCQTTLDFFATRFLQRFRTHGWITHRHTSTLTFFAQPAIPALSKKLQILQLVYSFVIILRLHVLKTMPRVTLDSSCIWFSQNCGGSVGLESFAQRPLLWCKIWKFVPWTDWRYVFVWRRDLNVKSLSIVKRAVSWEARCSKSCKWSQWKKRSFIKQTFLPDFYPRPKRRAWFNRTGAVSSCLTLLCLSTLGWVYLSAPLQYWLCLHGITCWRWFQVSSRANRIQFVCKTDFRKFACFAPERGHACPKIAKRNEYGTHAENHSTIRYQNYRVN